MKYEDNPKSIKFHVKKFFRERTDRFQGKVIVDFPAGNGVTSKIIQDLGGIPLPFDLFPEYFRVKGLTCVRANIQEGIPLANDAADGLICQEGIEHFPDQLHALREFNRVIKLEGMLLITTPNYSNLRAKVSYLLSESERFLSLMPPNEVDSIWMADKEKSNEIYYGHIFLIGIQKLRVLAKLSGFRIRQIHFTRLKSTSVLLFPFLYPFILMFNWMTYRRQLRRAPDKRAVYDELYQLSINPRILVSGHLMVEFEKESEVREVVKNLKGRHTDFTANT